MDVTKPFTSGETAIKAQLQAFRKQAARQAVSKAPPEKEQVPTADTIQIKEQLRHFRRRTGCGHGGIQLPPITEGSSDDDRSPTNGHGAPKAAAAAPQPRHGGGKGVGSKSECVRRCEEMERAREARRRSAADAKAQRAIEVEAAQAQGGIESVGRPPPGAQTTTYSLT